ncbi:MAG: histidine--tRNA ligase [SAR202 cluster bacterium]|nr:histidine--tRNA ligase [SAR202 cluster bacterium]
MKNKPKLQNPRGTFDILPPNSYIWKHIQNNLSNIAELFGYSPIATPIIEDSRLFARGVGEVTDIVEKETYTFQDRGGDLLSLRPEGTAPICRSYLQNGMHNLPQPIRLYYNGPFFRYDRPQAGRYRQLHQFGAELIGDSSSTTDVEIIQLAWNILHSLGIKNIKLLINSIGDSNCRANYINHLKKYLTEHINLLSHKECINRLETNPLRILDCKNESCINLTQNAPTSIDFLCEDCQGHWNKTKSLLGDLAIQYNVDTTLVRGLDYYTKTVFEIVPDTEGQQNTLAAGGRYDGLIEQLGGSSTPAVGFAMGIERTIEIMQTQNLLDTPKIAKKLTIAHVGEEASQYAMQLAQSFRQKSIVTIVAPRNRSLKSQLRFANSILSSHVVIIGESEIHNQTLLLRNLNTKEQQELDIKSAINQISK